MTTPAESPGKVTVDINLGCNEWKLQGRITIAAGPVTVGELLPVAWMLSDAIVKESVKVLDEMGSPISCKKGCGACCRNLVAISQPEARRLRQLVEELPEPRRSEIRARFSATLEKFATAGLLGQLGKSDDLSDDEYGELAQAYFEQKVACPFLEEEFWLWSGPRPIPMTRQPARARSCSANCSTT